MKYHWSEEHGKMMPGPSPRRRAARAPMIFNDRLYSDNPFRGHDGTLIHSRKSHRDYMRRNNLTTTDDFNSTYEKRAAERAALHTPGAGHDRERRLEAVRQAVEKHSG